jgi:hypothetical protein
MSDTTVQSTLFGAVLSDGSSLDGTWTTTYNASYQVVSVTATFEVFSATGGAPTIFTAPIVNQGADPTPGGYYELVLTQWTGGSYSYLYVDYDGIKPTTLAVNTVGNTPLFSTSVQNFGTTPAPIGLNPNETGMITSLVTCYAAGTMIRTPDGDVAVDTLTVGQGVVSAAGETKPIRWIGHRTIDIARHPQPEMVRPIRIAAGALADSIPARDLLVSPDHAMLVDNALIPARLLVNNRSITEEVGATAVTYYHVELDRHDIIIAEGAPSESYLDTGNRDLFANGPVTTMVPDMSVEQRLRTPEHGACMPLVTDAKTVFPIWQRLADRAGIEIADDSEAAASVHQDSAIALVVDSRTLRPVVSKDGTMVFALPRETSQVRLVSIASRPNQARPWLDDRRLLGVAVRGVSADNTPVPLDGPDFGAGWWGMEEAGTATYRWSNGSAMMTVPKDTKLLTVRVHAVAEPANQSFSAAAA